MPGLILRCGRASVGVGPKIIALAVEEVQRRLAARQRRLEVLLELRNQRDEARSDAGANLATKHRRMNASDFLVQLIGTVRAENGRALSRSGSHFITQRRHEIRVEKVGGEKQSEPAKERR